MKKQKKEWIEKKYSRKMLGLFILINLILVFIPVMVTITKMGWFAKNPTMDTEITAEEDAPVLKIVANSDFKPRTYINENGEWAGADVEVAIEAANRLGMRPEFAFSEWITARDTLKEGNADIILGLEIFSNMGGVIKTIPISSDNLNVYGKTKVTDAASLAGKKVGLMAKSVIISMFDLNCEYVEYSTNTEILQALAGGEVDYAICHGSIAQNIIKDHKLQLRECFTLMESYPSIGVREDLSELRDSLNSVLTDMADDGTIQGLESKWVTSSLNHESFTNVLQNNSEFYIGYFLFLMIAECMMIIFLLQLKHYRESIEYNKKIREQYRMLKSMAKVYVSMHLINLAEDKVTEFSSKDYVQEIREKNMSVAEQMRSIIKNTIVSEMLESALEFTDLSTIAERMGGNRILAKEFLGVHIGWIRAQFVAVSYDEEGKLSEVVFTTLSIEHEKEREQYLLHISNIDELTGIYNRRSYETDLEELNEDKIQDLVVISFDLNGLKVVNDTQGHQAGDLLLQHSAYCINDIFSPYGKVYRVGGDEFMALLHLDAQEMPSIKKTFLEKQKKESKTAGINISISCGYACHVEHKDGKIGDLVMLADKNMYQEKALHYKTTRDCGRVGMIKEN